MNRIADRIARRHGLWATLAVVSAIVPALFLPRAQIDNSIEVWLRSDTDEFKTYRDFLRRFGNDEFVIVAGTLEDPLSDESLALQQELAARLRTVENVAGVLDLPTMCRAVWSGEAGWERKAKDSDFLRNLLLGGDERTVGMVVWLEGVEGPGGRRRTLEALESATASFADRGFDAHLAGTPVMNVALDRASARAAAVFLPAAVLLSVAVLAVALRGWAAVAATMTAVGLTVAWTVGLIVVTGRSLNMISVVLPSLLFVLALSNGIHLALRFGANLSRCGDPDGAVETTIREMIRPVFLSSLTTAVGFGSLTISDMRPVAETGLFAAVGMLLSFVFNITIVPGLLSVFARRARAHRTLPARSGGTAGIFAIVGGSKIALPVAAALFTLFTIATSGLRAESNVLRFFRRNSKTAHDYAFVGKRLTGFYTVELDIRTSAGAETATLAALDRLGEAIASRPEVARVDHIGRLRPVLRQFADSALPALRDRGARTARGMGLLADFARRFRSWEGGTVSLRLSVLVRAMASSKFYALLDFIRERTREALPPSARWNLTGVVALLNGVQRSLVQTQIRSFAIAALVVLALIGILFRSARAVLSSLLPNLLPIFGAFAIMAIAKIPLDAATVMIAAVAIGIATNDTIHFLHRYREEKANGLNSVEASAAVLNKIGRAMVSTSLVAAGGFSVLCLANFRPIAWFGILMGTTMLMALAGDLFVLPACVRWFRLWEKK